MNIAIELSLNNDGLLLSTTNMDRKETGTIGDNNAQTLTFNRGGLTGNLQLSFRPGNDYWQVINIGTGSTYTIPNSLTGNRRLELSVALVTGTTVIQGANRLTFLYRPGGSGEGVVPSSIDSDWITVRDYAMLTTVYDKDQDGIIDADALPSEYGLFVDSREGATTGYWHKLFTCKINAYSGTDINMRLSVMELFSGYARPGGDLLVSVRQNTNGVLDSGSRLCWLSANINLTNYLNHFALNVVADSAGNYVELYIYNNTQYVGYKVNVMDKSSRGLTHALTFTGDVNLNASTTLTSLPTNGTIIYSTLGYYLQSTADLRTAVTALGGTI